MKEKKFTYRNIRHLLLIGLTLYSGFAFSQTGNVGINTPTPQKTLHVNGSLQVTNEFNLGGTATTAGSPGLTNQVMVSQGAGNPAIWKNVNDLITPNTYTLKIFKEIVTNQFSIGFNQVGSSYFIGSVSGLSITKPVNTIVVYIDIDAYASQIGVDTYMAYKFLTNIMQGGTEISVINSPNLILRGTPFSDSRAANFRSFVFRNVPVGTTNVNIYVNRQNSSGPNANQLLEFIPGNVHVYLYESN